METLTEIMIQPEHIDSLGHVNNIVYITYLEKARSEWFKKIGLSFKDLHRRNVGTVVVRMDIQYRKEMLLDDKPRILTIPDRIGTSSFAFKQIIYNQNDEIVTEAIITEVMFDKKSRKSIPVAKEIRDGFLNS